MEGGSAFYLLQIKFFRSLYCCNCTYSVCHAILKTASFILPLRAQAHRPASWEENIGGEEEGDRRGWKQKVFSTTKRTGPNKHFLRLNVVWG